MLKSCKTLNTLRRYVDFVGERPKPGAAFGWGSNDGKPAILLPEQ
jgi:hypothetical protein